MSSGIAVLVAIVVVIVTIGFLGGMLQLAWRAAVKLDRWLFAKETRQQRKD